MLDKVDPVLPFLAVGSFVKIVFAFMNKDKKPKNLVCVGKVKKLSVFPVKSMSGVYLDTVECTQKGVKFPDEPVFDRTFMVVTEKGTFVSARAHPKLAIVKPRLERHHLILEAEGIEPLKLPKVCLRDQTKEVIDATVWGEKCQGQDCGEEAAVWINKFLNKKGFRLIYNMESLLQRPLLTSQVAAAMRFKPKEGDRAVFHDGFPFMLMCLPSLEDLNTRLTQKVPIDNFRPNIVVDGTAPYEEDDWSDIWIGDVKFTNTLLCERCTMTGVNPEKGVMDKSGEPLKTLKSYRYFEPSYSNGPSFGIFMFLDSPNGSTINVGDCVYVKPKS